MPATVTAVAKGRPEEFELKVAGSPAIANSIELIITE
jgi:hypothetical protein